MELKQVVNCVGTCIIDLTLTVPTVEGKAFPEGFEKVLLQKKGGFEGSL